MENTVKSKRIWEIDAFRGIFIWGMVVVHILYDIKYIFEVDFNGGIVYDIASKYGSILFIVLSGISVTFGKRNIKRGLILIGFGLAITATMAVLSHFFPENFGNIYFGILHFLGTAMLLYSLFKRMPIWLLAICSVVFLQLGFIFSDISLEGFAPLFVLGFNVSTVTTLDYFPLFPNLSWFVLGIILGRTLYSDRQSKLPEVFGNNFLAKFFIFSGKHSLWIYLFHQPLVYGVLWLVFNKIL